MDMFHIYFLKLLDLKYNFTKIGRTSGTLDRMSSYNTSCPLTPSFIYFIIECDSLKVLKKLEKFLHNKFYSLSTIHHRDYKESAGKEWFQKEEFTYDEIIGAIKEFKYKDNCKTIYGDKLK